MNRLCQLWQGLMIFTLSTLAYQSVCHATEPTEFALFEDIPTVFSASRIAEPLLEAPAAMSVISDEDLESWGIVDLPDAFRYVPGMDVIAFNGREWGVSARGFADRFAGRMLVLIDGMSVYIPLTSGTAWQDIPIIQEDIDSIEIVRGPNDTAYGFNATNGVININTKKPQDTQGFFGRYLYGSHDRDKFVGRYGESVDFKDFGKLDLRVSYSFNQTDGYGRRNGQEFQDRRIHNQVNVRSQYTLSEKLDAEFFFGVLDGEQDNPPIPTGTPTFKTNLNNHFVQTQVNMHPNEQHDAFIKFYFWNRTADAKLLQGGNETRDSNERQLDLEFQDTITLGDGKSQTVIGGNYRNTRVSSLLIRRKIEGNSHQHQTTKDHLFSFFVNEKLTLLQEKPLVEKLTLVAGIRGEGSQLIPTLEWAPRISLLYSPKKQHVTRLTYARAFKLPSFIEEHISFFTPEPAGTLFQIQGNRDLKREQVHSFEAGYSGIFLDQKLNLDADFYFAKYQGVIQGIIQQPLILGVQPQISTFNNSSNARALGIEVAGKYKATDWLEMFVNYTYEHITQDNSPNITRRFDNSTPRNKANFGVHVKLQEEMVPKLPQIAGTSINANLSFRDAYKDYDVTGVLAPTIFSVKPNIRLDMRVAKTFLDDSVEVAFIAQNLVGAGHNEARFVEVPRMLLLSVSLKDSPWEIYKRTKQSE